MSSRSLFERFLWITCRGWLAGGLCSLTVALGFGFYTGGFLARSVAAKGTIVSLEPVPDEENDTVNYAPVFAFTAADGHAYTVRSGTATNPPGFVVGEDVRVLYVKSDPEGAKLASFWQLWFVTVLLAGLGTLFTGAGYGILRYERRRARRRLSNSTPGPPLYGT